MQFLVASAEMTRWLIAHLPSRRKHPSVALPDQNIAGYLLQSHKQVGISKPSPLMIQNSFKMVLHGLHLCYEAVWATKISSKE